MNLLTHLCDEKNSVIVFGEIYGLGVQDLDYGTKDGYRVFDISVNGKYLDWEAVKAVLPGVRRRVGSGALRGAIHKDLVKRFTYGPTTLANPDKIRSSFKDREGCVITPQVEQFYAPTGGRLILKSVSADYLDRKGATGQRMNATPKITYRQYGGKASIAKWVVSHFPEHRVYLEACCASAAVLLAKPRSFTEIINDLDGKIMHMWRTIKSRPKELAALLWATPYAPPTGASCRRPTTSTKRCC